MADERDGNAGRFFYVTCANRDEALAIAGAVVEARLAACANILDGMTSVFRWEDRIETDTETVLVLKSREAQVAPLIERVRALHSYECPCIVVLPLVAGHAPFLDWIAAETQGSSL